MELRNLELQDASLMLEWMHDKTVVEYLQSNFLERTLKDCEDFIALSKIDKSNLNLAIINKNNIYMGTVSLKNITETDAEFAITMRRAAMGKMYAKFAMEEILRIGFEKFNLKRIFWCVSPENKRAIRFYDKNGYSRIKIEKYIKIRGYTYDQIQKYLWYEQVNNEDA